MRIALGGGPLNSSALLRMSACCWVLYCSSSPQDFIVYRSPQEGKDESPWRHSEEDSKQGTNQVGSRGGTV